MLDEITLKDDVIPALLAFERIKGYGKITLTFEGGVVQQFEIAHKIRVKDQMRYWMKQLIGL